MNRELALNDLPLGHGVFARRVWVREDESPIVLVGLMNGSGAEKYSRLDLQKSMFIDPLPHEAEAECVGQLVEAVRAAEGDAEQ